MKVIRGEKKEVKLSVISAKPVGAVTPSRSGSSARPRQSDTFDLY